MKIDNIEAAQKQHKLLVETGRSLSSVREFQGKAKVGFTFGVHQMLLRADGNLSKELLATTYDYFVEQAEDCYNALLEMGVDVSTDDEIVPIGFGNDKTNYSIKQLLSKTVRDQFLNIKRDGEGNKL